MVSKKVTTMVAFAMISTNVMTPTLVMLTLIVSTFQAHLITHDLMDSSVMVSMPVMMSMNVTLMCPFATKMQSA